MYNKQMVIHKKNGLTCNRYTREPSPLHVFSWFIWTNQLDVKSLILFVYISFYYIFWNFIVYELEQVW
jgi:hypothetical protein